MARWRSHHHSWWLVANSLRKASVGQRDWGRTRCRRPSPLGEHTDCGGVSGLEIQGKTGEVVDVIANSLSLIILSNEYGFLIQHSNIPNVQYFGE